MPEDEEGVKQSLQKYLNAVEQVKKLIHGRGTDISKHAYTDEEMQALRIALKEEAEAKKEYFTLVFERLNWSEKEIQEWMKKNI